ncbi:MAG: hypothetical protein K6E17_08065 [Clostridiales bacterium]|nr:hypothetical protein [Clostridiales bacterium]
MKKYVAFLLTLVLAALPVAGALCEEMPGGFFSAAPGPARNADLDAVFTYGGTVRLVPADLGGGEEAGMPLALSPDGKIVIRNGAIQSRDGKSIPMTLNLTKGVGDPNGSERYLVVRLDAQPSWEGLSWSADGHYVAFSELEFVLKYLKSINVPVLDTETGEIYLADSFARKTQEEDYGLVLLSRIDRTGRYLYYLVQTSGDDGFSHYCFCRCPVSGGNREILCDMVVDENAAFSYSSGSTLFETGDGDWLLAGVKGRSNAKDARLALIRFSDSWWGWTYRVTSLGIPSSIWSYALPSWSASSGYGLFCLENILARQVSAQSSIAQSGTENSRLIQGMVERVSLARILPGENSGADVWYMIRTGESDDSVKLLPAEGFLNAVRIMKNPQPDDEKEQLREWFSAFGEERDGSVFPKGYDYETYRDEMNRLLHATCAAVSPDGYYALVNAGTLGHYRLYLVSLETMEVLPVEAPEGVGGTNLSYSPIGAGYKPGIVWNGDGTLLIQHTGTDSDVHAYRMEVSPAR